MIRGARQASVSQGLEPTAPTQPLQVRQAHGSSVVEGSCIGQAGCGFLKAELVREGTGLHFEDAFVVAGG